MRRYLRRPQMKNKILIIDDDRDLSELIASALKSQGYDVSILNSGKQAVRIIKKELPELVLLDVHLPDVDGYNICDQLKSNDDTKHIPVIILTGQEMERELVGDIHDFYGASDYLKKPFELDELLSKIKKLLSSQKK